MSQLARNLRDKVSKTEKGEGPEETVKALIRIENVTKRFGDFVAVSDVSLTIYQGELFSLLGGSGCGKTTLLRMLAGFETPSAGRILIDGQDMTDVPPYERPVNMMFQSYALFPHMSVEQNVAFGLKQDNLSRVEIRNRVEEMLDMVELGHLARRRPHELSGGQRQRVALARALAKRPKVLLLDEPLAALDKKLRERTQLELVGIQESLGVTFVVVTHDQEEAMTMSTRVAIMNQGHILQVDTPYAMYEYPNTRYVAEFFGSVNLFEAILIEDEPDHIVAQSSDLDTPIYVGHGISAREGATVYAAIRPEKITLSKEMPTDTSHNISAGTVQDIVYLGGESTYLVRLDTGRIVRVDMQNQTRSSQPEITWEDRVWIVFEGSNVVVVTS
ncbi:MULTISPECIES: ABC transporter ATP-binding protein [unclassified Haematospirillum]|uniref:ABC transporter ATP-binding protein n=1 Tax=unclassified Haematospirillum TaxID=2622088 RepID=UPI00143A3869|nr:MULTISPECIES: polyamine ABC transporter ATP-binding protein [unclassified Haematospirillum]NKD54550.1 polyamine ABC transporter ATP-binding protein [Haematospirillum sp. H4890]NKD74838.1 polyamine ABC transporter ATP-binding protein [Haematospirillum sp. H4485]